MEPFTQLTGLAAPLMLANIDTDVIIRIERLTAGDPSILGHYAFEALRYRPDGSKVAGFVLNKPAFSSAPILVAGTNFGCGSSREGAVLALLGLGLRCVIADSFGDIFFSNCFQNGLLPIRLPAAVVATLAQHAERGTPFAIDLFAQSVTVANEVHPFDIDQRRRQSLLEGLDDVGLSIKQMEVIRAWQTRDQTQRPWVWSVGSTQ